MKLSKATARHYTVPGYVEAFEQEVGDWSIGIERTFTDMDQAPFYKGAPNDQCQAHHMGYVLEGRFGIRTADGTEEIFEAGDAFVIEPGHTPLMFAGCEFVSFTPTAEAREQAAVMMPNVLKFAEEQGVELPADLMSA